MFSKASTRTRASFAVGVGQLGGMGHYMNAATELQSVGGEPLRDTARALGRYYDCVVWRTYRQADLEEFASYAGVPVINGMTDYAHPLPGAGRPDDHSGAAGQSGRPQALLCRRRGQHGQQPDRRRPAGWDAGMLCCPPGYRPAADVILFAQQYPQLPAADRPCPGSAGCRRRCDRRLELRPRHRGRASAAAGLCRLSAHRCAAAKRKTGVSGAAQSARPPGVGDLGRCI